MEVQEEEAMVQEADMAQEEELCGDLPRQAGMAMDVVDDLPMALQWLVVLLLQDITTITFTVKDRRLASHRRMVEAHHLDQCRKCPLARLSKWIIAQAHLLTIMD